MSCHTHYGIFVGCINYNFKLNRNVNKRVVKHVDYEIRFTTTTITNRRNFDKFNQLTLLINFCCFNIGN